MRRSTASHTASCGASSRQQLSVRRRAVWHDVPIRLVLVLVVLVIAMSGCGHEKADTGSAIDITGVDWVLVSAHSQQKSATPLKGDFRAFLHFQAGGEFLGNDGLNPFQGSYSIDGQTLTINTAATAIGAAGTAVDDPRVDAMDSLIFPTSTDKTSVTSQFTVVPGSTEHPAELTIEGAIWTLMFQPGDLKTATTTH